MSPVRRLRLAVGDFLASVILGTGLIVAIAVASAVFALMVLTIATAIGAVR